MAESKSTARSNLIAKLKKELLDLPPRERKSFLRGWMQADAVFHGKKRRKIRLD